VLTLSTMLFGDEVLAPEGIDELGGLSEAPATDRELAMARQLIDSLSNGFDPGRYRDDYRDRVLQLIEAKASGQPVAPPPAEAESAPAPDLMAALEASLAAMESDRAASSNDGDAGPKQTSRPRTSRAGDPAPRKPSRATKVKTKS
jgi:DNA end-binding protein Ku